MNKRLLSTTLILLAGFATLFGQPYKLVVHNVENIFDADGYAVYSDYRPFDIDNNIQYSTRHLLTKLQKTSRLMARYNDGNGPDIIMLVEMESDFTPQSELPHDISAFLEQYSDVDVSYMLTDGFNEDVMFLPTELWLLKAFEDHGLTGYDVSVAYERDENGRPTHAVKNVIFSRLPIDHSRTRSHAIEGARPILETWVDANGYDLVLFNNHWRSRASDEEMEKIRVQNAQVLKDRLDELRAENLQVDFILGGDFNSDYNQSHRYQYMEVTAVNDVLRSVGDERKVKRGDTDAVYNLWYEYDIDRRGSDTFRGYWGTLMQLMISPGLYDYYGVQYVDGSFDVGIFPGKNVYPNSLTPRRWHFKGDGGGYSDHLPISMKFTVVENDDPNRRMTLTNPGVNDDEQWSPIAVSYSMPDRSDVVMPEDYEGKELRTAEFFDQLLLIESEISEDFTVMVMDKEYDLWSPTFRINDEFRSVAGTGEKVRFIGRLGLFRGDWQFVIEDKIYINPEWD